MTTDGFQHFFRFVSLAGRLRTYATMTVVPLVIAVATCVVYIPSLSGPFLYDDIGQIENNPALDSLWPPTVPMFEGPAFPKRPLPYFTFAVNIATHGRNPWGFRLVNLAIHLINGLLLWKTGAAILQRLPGRPPLDPVLTAGVAAALWLVHPLCTQPVAYVYQRMELLGATAITVTLLSFLRSLASTTPGRWQTTAVAASAIGMLCKETVVAAPLTVLLVDAFVTQAGPANLVSRITGALRRRPRFYAALFATLAIAGTVVWRQRDAYPELGSGTWPPLAYAATQPWAIARYLQLAVWPAGQCFDYGWTPVQSVTLAATGLVIIAGVLGGAAFWSERRPGPALAVLVFFSLLAPTSSILPVHDIVVEHRMYLPLFVAVIGMAAGIGHLVATLPRSSPAGRTPFFLALATILLVAFVVTTAYRASVYRSLLALWGDTAAKAPLNPRAHLWHGIALAEIDRPAEAFDAFGRTIALAPRARETARAHAWRAAILGRAGHPEEAAVEADAAVRLDPRDPLGWANLGRVCVDLGRYDEAIESCARALAIDPTLGPTAALLRRLEILRDNPEPGASR